MRTQIQKLQQIEKKLISNTYVNYNFVQYIKISKIWYFLIKENKSSIVKDLGPMPIAPLDVNQKYKKSSSPTKQKIFLGKDIHDIWKLGVESTKWSSCVKVK